MWCEVKDIRNSNQKFGDVLEAETATISNRITEAEDEIKVDLSSVITEDELDTIAATSKAVKLLTIYKASEKTLVSYHGANRKVDEVSDVQYFQKKYNTLLEKILNGTIKLIADDTDYSPKNYPKATGTNTKFYPRKGVEGFYEDGVDTDYQDDRYK